MTPKKQYLTAILISTLVSGFAMGQMPGEGRTGGGTNTNFPNFMWGERGAQMMGGEMMRSDMVHGMAGTINQMQDIMQKMAGTMAQGQTSLEAKAVADMSKKMDDMASMMQNMAARTRDGKMDQAMLKDMNLRLDAMGKSLKPMQHPQEGMQSKGDKKDVDKMGMEQGLQGMDMKDMADMPKKMDDMASMMQNMAARMRDGKMDQAMLKDMNERLKSLEKSLTKMKNMKGMDKKGMDKKGMDKKDMDKKDMDKKDMDKKDMSPKEDKR